MNKTFYFEKSFISARMVSSPCIQPSWSSLHFADHLSMTPNSSYILWMVKLNFFFFLPPSLLLALALPTLPLTTHSFISASHILLRASSSFSSLLSVTILSFPIYQLSSSFHFSPFLASPLLSLHACGIFLLFSSALSPPSFLSPLNLPPLSLHPLSPVPFSLPLSLRPSLKHPLVRAKLSWWCF